MPMSLEEEMKQWEAKHEEEQRYFYQNIRPKLRRATARDYRKWLEGWAEKEGETTHHYDYNLRDSWYVAKADMHLPRYYGSSSVQIIVPEGITVTFTDGLGHNNLYFMEDFDQAGGWVPTYRNVTLG